MPQQLNQKKKLSLLFKNNQYILWLNQVHSVMKIGTTLIMDSDGDVNVKKEENKVQ